MFKNKTKPTELAFPDSKDSIANIVNIYLESDDFINKLTKHIMPKLIAYFEDNYNLINNPHFNKEVEYKHEYLTQLDKYLEERKEFKTRIEQQLESFLLITKSQLDESLDRFSKEIIKQVSDIEVAHPIKNRE